MRVKVITKDGIVLERDIAQITLPSVCGAMQVLPGHASSVIVLKKGNISFDSTSIPVKEGVARVYSGEVSIFLPDAEIGLASLNKADHRP